jgi:hypothetical protein
VAGGYELKSEQSRRLRKDQSGESAFWHSEDPWGHGAVVVGEEIGERDQDFLEVPIRESVTGGSATSNLL